MNGEEFLTKMLHDDYQTKITYESDKNKTLTDLGLDSLDQVEFAHLISDRKDFTKRLPENLPLCQIVDYINNQKQGVSNVTT